MLETLPNQPRGYGPQDAPRSTATPAAPTACSLPNPPWSQTNPVRHQPDFDDGVDEPTGKGTSRGAAPATRARGAGYAGGRQEAGLLKSLLGPALGVTADDVPDLGVLLVGPMARGRRCR